MSSAAGRWGFADAALELIRPGHGDTQSADVAQDAPDRLGAPLGADHFVQFYEDDSDLSRVVAIFLGDGIRAGDSLVVIATQAHERLFRQQLASLGLDPAQVQFFDAHDTLSKILRDGQPDREAFERCVGSLIGNLCAGLSGERSLRAYGEMVDVLWQGGRREEAIRLEELWNDLQERHSFVLLCAYALVSFDNEPANHHRVCAAHTHVVSDRPSHIESTAAPSLHARRLASEIARREEIEKTLRDSLRTLRTREEELRAREQELRKSEEQLRDFVENAPLGLHRVGPDGTILWANQAELDLLGYAANEYVGRNIAAFHADADVIEDILVRLRGGEVLHNRETRMRAKDGSLRYVLLSSNACVQDGEFIYTRCFTRDITERRQAEQALRESERLLRLVTDALPVLVAFVDAQGRYRFVSAMYERWFGRSRETIVGKSVAEVVGETAYTAIKPHIERALAGTTVTFEAELDYLDAGRRFIEATYVPQQGSNGSIAGFVALIVDVGERRAFERFRADAAQRAERLLQITAAIADAISSAEVFEALVDQVAEAVGASSSGLWLVDDDQKVAKLARSRGYNEGAAEKLETLPLDRSASLPVLDCIRSGQAIWIPSQAALIERYPHLAPLTERGRSYRVACLPLFTRSRVVGTLALTIEQIGETSEDEQEFLLLVARYASQAVERLRLFEAERRSRGEADAAAKRLGALSQASQVFARANLDLQLSLRDVVSELGTTLASTVGISLLQLDGLLHNSAVYHPDPEAHTLLQGLGATAPLRVGEGVTGSVAATGKSVLIPHIEPEEMSARAAPAYRSFLERFPTYAMIVAPLRAQGKIIGTVTATRGSRNNPYSTEDLRLLEELAERAGVAIENARLYQETVEARTRAEQLYRFAQAVVAADRVEAVFDAAIAAIEAALGATRSAVLTFDDDGVMRFRAWHHLSDAYRNAVEGHSPWPPDAVAPEPVLVPAPARDPAMASYLPLFQSEGIGALAFIPLVTRGKLLGKFMVYYDQPHPFASHEVETARAIANHLASVITRFATVAKLEDTIRSNELFAGALAHDLRNPLSAVVMAAQSILMRGGEEDDRNDAARKQLGRILSSGRRMETMIEQLLDFTRARSGGGIDIDLADANLAELCTQAVEELELSHPEWKIRREAIGDPRGTWDPARLLQVVSNLTANAGQHGNPDAGISVRLDGTHRDHVTLEVHNEGAIPESLLPNLFDPFRGSLQRRKQARGLGLGLFIVREIVRAHGGTVEVSSSLAAGTTFSIRLPRHSSRRAPRTDNYNHSSFEPPT